MTYACAFPPVCVSDVECSLFCSGHGALSSVKLDLDSHKNDTQVGVQLRNGFRTLLISNQGHMMCVCVCGWSL